jgi:hypothetical protein
VKKCTGHIQEGWLGEDRSTEERMKGGSEYVMDVLIGPTCKLSFQVIARSLDEAKSIINSFVQYSIDWDGGAEEETVIERFWNETIPLSHRVLSDDSRCWLAKYVKQYGEEATKAAVVAAAKKIDSGTYTAGVEATRYVGGILRRPTALPKVAEPVHVSGKATDTLAWKTDGSVR